MEYYVVDVKSLININEEDISFDYCNIYFDLLKAEREAKSLSLKESTKKVHVLRFFVKPDGNDEIDKDYYGYYYEK